MSDKTDKELNDKVDTIIKLRSEIHDLLGGYDLSVGSVLKLLVGMVVELALEYDIDRQMLLNIIDSTLVKAKQYRAFLEASPQTETLQ